MLIGWDDLGVQTLMGGLELEIVLGRSLPVFRLLKIAKTNP